MVTSEIFRIVYQTSRQTAKPTLLGGSYAQPTSRQMWCAWCWVAREDQVSDWGGHVPHDAHRDSYVYYIHIIHSYIPLCAHTQRYVYMYITYSMYIHIYICVYIYIQYIGRMVMCIFCTCKPLLIHHADVLYILTHHEPWTARISQSSHLPALGSFGSPWHPKTRDRDGLNKI